MKIVKHRNLMGLFFAIFMMLPFVAIGVRCAYITFNKNAKNSYYGETINETQYIYETTFKPNQDMYYVKPNGINTSDTTSYIKCEFIDFNCDRTQVQDWFDLHESQIGGFQIYYTGADYQIRFYDLNDVYNGVDYWGLGNSGYNIHFVTSNSGTISDTNNFYYVSYNKYSYLDNAFIYSVHEITDNNLGKIDFFSFFANMFLDLNNPKTQIYVNFVNWYFNYMLLVSLAYLLFFVIMWFINYIRQILERGNSLGHGGF